MISRLFLIPGLIFLGTGLADAQSHARPRTFLGLNWGAPRAETLNALTTAGATAPAPGEVLESTVQATGGTFAGQEVAMWVVEFMSEKFVGASVTLKPNGSGSALYREIKEELGKKYGPSTGERKLNTMTPAQRKAVMAAGTRLPNQGSAVTWKFPPNLKDKDDLSISCEKTPPPGVTTEDETKFVVTLRYSANNLKAQFAIGETVDRPAPAKPTPAGTPRKLVGKDL